MNKKNLILVVMTALLLFMQPTFADEDKIYVEYSPHRLLVDGKSYHGIEIYNIEGNNYLKLRDIAYMAKDTEKQFSVNWNRKKQLTSLVTGATYHADGSELSPALALHAKEIAIKSKSRLEIDGKLVELESYIINNVFYFKLKDLARELFFDADWDDNCRQIIVKFNQDFQHDCNPRKAMDVATLVPEMFYLKYYQMILVFGQNYESYNEDGKIFYKYGGAENSITMGYDFANGEVVANETPTNIILEGIPEKDNFCGLTKESLPADFIAKLGQPNSISNSKALDCDGDGYILFYTIDDLYYIFYFPSEHEGNPIISIVKNKEVVIESPLVKIPTLSLTLRL